MNRTEKRCLVTATSLHLLLILVLVIGTAFFAPPPKRPAPRPIQVISGKIVDDLLSSAARAANEKPNEEKQKGEVQTPQPEPQPEPPPTPVQPKPKEPVQPKTPEPPKKVEKPKEPEPAPPKNEPTPKPKPKLDNIKKLDRNEAIKKYTKETEKAPPAPPRNETAEALNKVAKEVTGTSAKLRTGLEPGVQVTTPSGAGSESFVNYVDLIFNLYDRNWILTRDLNGKPGQTKVKVVIHRSGRILQETIITPSGNKALDDSVREALDRVRQAPPFPAGSTDDQREFIIVFDLQAKQGLG